MSFAPLSISRNGNDVTLSGDLPDGAAKASLLDAVKGALGADLNLIDNVNINAGVNAPDFSGLQAVFQAGATIPDFNFNLDGDAVTLTGTAASEDEKAAVGRGGQGRVAEPEHLQQDQVNASPGAPGRPVRPRRPDRPARAPISRRRSSGLLGTPINFETS